ncbi:hypothetical protein JAMGFMIE_03498 [Rheinheimera sp. MM224]|nr:hypothetical protein JAMGFMIE_03498 [Rheinheimera sp. MM224]
MFCLEFLVFSRNIRSRIRSSAYPRADVSAAPSRYNKWRMDMLIDKNNKNIVNALGQISKCLRHSKIQLPDSSSRYKFVFLCGANKATSEVSERRTAVIDFARKQLPNTKVLLAEEMFKTLKIEGHKGNILDVEDLISKFSDFIIIILESPSAFAELGAFANPQLRDKLIIINDEQYRTSESFINLGPIAAVEENSGTERVIHYRMNSNGINVRDSIGDIYPELYDLLSKPVAVKDSAINIHTLDPSLVFDKKSVLFIHDLIYILGPVTHKELIEAVKLIFGVRNHKYVVHIIAVLKAFGSVSKDDNDRYKSAVNSLYFSYKFDLDKVIATFRNHTMKYHSRRLYGS